MKKPIYSTLLATLLIVTAQVLSAQTANSTTLSSARLFSDPDNISSVIMYIPAASEIEVMELSGDYALVNYKDTKGWVRADKIKNLQSLADQSREIQQPIYDNRNNQQYIDRFSLLVGKYGYSTGKAIYEHKIWKGIDHNMVRDSWGKPLNVSREMKSSGTIELWTYRNTWLLFRNDILSEWGPNKN